MKIGIDCRLWDESGVGRYTRNLVKELSLIGTKNDYVLFILPKDEESIRQQVAHLRQGFGGQAEFKGNKWKIVITDIRWHTLAEQIRFPAILLKEKLDLVHFLYFSVPIGYYKPFVVTIHDLIIYHFPTGQASTLPLPIYKAKHFGYKQIIQQAANRACRIISPLNATKQDIVTTLNIPAEKIAVSYEGVDDGISFNPSNILKAREQRTRLQLINKNYFLYVGNAYPHKNLETLLQAFRLFIAYLKTSSVVFPGQNDLQLLFVGKEDFFYKRLKKQVAEGELKSKVQFYGEATDIELISLYQNAKALILPSLMEGFGLPVLEAMANKCLVLVSDIPSLREVCLDAAIYFNQNDIHDMKQKMLDVCFNDLNHFSKNIDKGLERVKMFSWRRMAEETLKVYESCLGL